MNTFNFSSASRPDPRWKWLALFVVGMLVIGCVLAIVLYTLLNDTSTVPVSTPASAASPAASEVSPDGVTSFPTFRPEWTAVTILHPTTEPLPLATLGGVQVTATVEPTAAATLTPTRTPTHTLTPVSTGAAISATATLTATVSLPTATVTASSAYP